MLSFIACMKTGVVLYHVSGAALTADVRRVTWEWGNCWGQKKPVQAVKGVFFLMNEYQCIVTLFNKTSLSTDKCKTNPFFPLNCRDTAGQERFRTITTAYYRGAMVSAHTSKNLNRTNGTGLLFLRLCRVSLPLEYWVIVAWDVGVWSLWFGWGFAVCFSFFKCAGTWSRPVFCDETSSPIVFLNIIKISADFNKISYQALIRSVWVF